MTDDELKNLEVSKVVDARGMACPGPLLETKKGIGKVRVGETMEVYSNDEGTRIDVKAWAGKVGHSYLGYVEADGYDKHYVTRNK